MITYLQFKEIYTKQVYNLIYNIMLKELKIDSNLLSNIARDLENIREAYINKGGNFWIAIDTETNDVVGSVGILKIDNCTAEFKRFYVREDYRNKHIGLRLYQIAENYAKNNKIKTLYLVSGNKSKKAQSIYCKNGWQLTNKNDEGVNINVRDGVDLYKKDFIDEEIDIMEKYVPVAEINRVQVF